MRKSQIDATEYEPFLEDGQQLGEVHWLRQSSDVEAVHLAGVWRISPEEAPESFEYPFETEETIHVLEGSVTIDIPGAEPLFLTEGDIASFTKGTASTWSVQAPFRKFFVCS